MARELTAQDFENLLEFRVALRRFNRWSEEQAAEVGLTHAQHQLLVAVKGHREERGPTMGEIADYLLVQHHSAVGLVGRAEANGVVKRQRDDDDRRVVRIVLTDLGESRVQELTELHLNELRALAPMLDAILDEL